MAYDLSKLTPNLIVSDIARSIAFYRDVLGFTLTVTVPDESPFVFAILESGPVEIFLNERETAVAEYPAFKDQPIGGTLTLFLHVSGIQQIHDDLRDRVSIVMPLEKKWYGTTEFACTDPDGYIITFAERDEQSQP